VERMGGSSDKQHGFDRCRREVKQRQSQKMVMVKMGVRVMVLSGKKCLQRIPRIPIITILTHGCYDDFPTTRTSMAFAPRGEGVRTRPLRHSMMCKADLWVGLVGNPHRTQEQASPPCLHAAPHTRPCEAGHDCITLPQCPSSL
jgi:hypothetical protein